MKKRVLVIDDCPLQRAMATDILKKEGFIVHTAQSALAANEVIYSDEKPDVILMDVVMPLMSGDRKIEYLKRRKDSEDIPVLLFSSKSEQELEFLVQATGAAGYIRKPFTPKQLVNRVAQQIE